MVDGSDHCTNTCNQHASSPFPLFSVRESFQFASLLAKTKTERWKQYFTRAEREFQSNEYERSLYYLRRAYNALKQWRPNKREADLKSYTYAKILKLLGDCHLHLKREYEAIEYYEKSLAYNLKQKEILRFLGEFYLDVGDFTKATYYLDQYCQKITNKNKKIRFLLAYALAKSGKREQAKTIINKTANTVNFAEENDAKQGQCEKIEKQEAYAKATHCYDSLLLEQAHSIQLYYTLIRIAQKIKSREGTKFLIKYAEYLYLFYGNNEKHAWPYVFALYNDKRYKKTKKVLKKIKETLTSLGEKSQKKQTLIEQLERQIDYEQN